MISRLDHTLTAAADRWPGSPAVVDGHRTLGYHELAELAVTLSGRLRRCGVGAGVRVGMYLPRSATMVTAIHGVLRAGGVVAPLDIADPPGRTDRVIRSSGLGALLVDRGTASVADRLQATAGHRAHDVGQGLTLYELSTGPGGQGEPDDGYVFSTSGSTGWPKGVLLSHRNVLHFAEWAVTELGLRDTDRVGSASAFTFDLSTFDIFSSAIAGAALHLVPEGLLAFPRDLAGWLRHSRISAFYAVPTLYRMLLRRGLEPSEGLPNLRLLLMAGEPIPPDLLDECRRRFPDATVANLYGPTETNVCTFERFAPDWSPADGITIGQPIDETHVVLLDETGRAGERGELFVAGPTVLRGYLEQGELRDPTKTIRFPDGVRRRAYGTGDRATRLPDGRLRLDGRIDEQVKRRGHRIELRDIENAVQERCRPEQCAVVAKQGPDAEEIWAYVVGDGLTSHGVVAALAEVLPRRMLPDRVVVARRLPTSAHGKVDRRSLAQSPARGEDTHEISR